MIIAAQLIMIIARTQFLRWMGSVAEYRLIGCTRIASWADFYGIHDFTSTGGEIIYANRAVSSAPVARCDRMNWNSFSQFSVDCRQTDPVLEP